MKSRLSPLALAMLGAVFPCWAAAQSSHTVRVVVAYTADAQTWADSQQFTCGTILDTPAIAEKLAKIKALTNIRHVCEENPTLGRSSNYINNLIDIAIAETNKIYQDSGIGNVNIVLADRFLVSNGTDHYKEGLVDGDIQHPEPLIKSLIKDMGLGMAVELSKLRSQREQSSNGSLLNMVHNRRAAAQGDIVVLLTNNEIDNFVSKGITYDGTMGLAAGIGVDNPDEGFAALTIDKATAPGFNFAHEVSHLFGANHDGIRVVVSGIVNVSQDVIAGTPHMVNNKISGWGYVNKTTSWKWPDPVNGPNTQTGYQDLMSYSCSTCIGLPILSTLNPGPGVTTTVAYGFAGDSSNKRRDNASAVAAGAAKLAAFGERLASMADPAPASGSTKIGIDFGEHPTYGWNINNGATYTLSYDFKTPTNFNWNHVANRTDLTPINLVDQVGSSTLVSLAITQPFAARTATGLFSHDGKAAYAAQVFLAYGLDEMPGMAMADGFLSKGSQHGKFELRGLDPNATYYFKIFGSQEAGEKTRLARYELKGAGGTVYSATLPTHGNILRFAKLKGVKPQSNGVIEFTLKPDSSVPSTVSVPLNAIEFYPHH